MPTGEHTTGLNSGTATHTVYTCWASDWRWLCYVYEGSGPFQTGGALQPHPREYLDHHTTVTEPVYEINVETGAKVYTGATKQVTKVNPRPSIPSPKLIERQRLASYENIAAPIIDHKLAALFRQPPDRRVAGGNDGERAEHDWLTWCDTDVDGAGTPMNGFMREAWRIAAIFGHAVVLMDRRPATVDQPVSRAQQGGMVLRLYTPLDMPDWIQDEAGALKEVKLFEVVPRESLKTATANSQTVRLRYVTADTFEVVDEVKGSGQSTPVNNGDHGFGTVPVAILYAKRRALTPLIGQSVLYDPRLYIDLYNLKSEKRELLRKQTFSILNVPLGTGPDATPLSDAKNMIGETVATNNVLFSGQPAQYISADSANVEAYAETERLALRTIYRLANVPFETDTKDAESEGSLSLKREDMNQVLASHADECELFEEQIAKLWFRGTYGPDKWEAEWERVEPSIAYPDKFDTTSLEDLLVDAAAAMGLKPLAQSQAFTTELAKSLVPKLLPGAEPDTIKAILAEIENFDPEQERADRLKEMAMRWGPDGQQPPDGKQPPVDPSQEPPKAA